MVRRLSRRLVPGERDGRSGSRPENYPEKRDWKGACDTRDFAYSHIGNHAYWLHTGYNLVLCDRFGDDTFTHDGQILFRRRSLGDSLSIARENPNPFANNPAELAFNRAHTYFHELLHMHNLVGNPPIDEVRSSMFSGGLYGAEASAKITEVYGAARKVRTDVENHGGEWGATVNVGKWTCFANSLYFRQQLNQSTPPRPDICYWPDKAVAPEPKGRITTEDDGLAVLSSINEITFGDHFKPFVQDTKPVLFRETPPPPPVCTPGKQGMDPDRLQILAEGFCATVDGDTTKAFSHTASGNSLDPPQLGAFKVSFDFKPAPPPPGASQPFDCGMPCTSVIENLTKTCHFDTHTIDGSTNIPIPCGTYSFSVQDPKS